MTAGLQRVNCRVGSLEKQEVANAVGISVNCRVGSLEIKIKKRLKNDFVNCRVGSLEKYREPPILT